MIEIIDNICSYEDNIALYDYLIHQPFRYGEVDSNLTPPTGLVYDIDERTGVVDDLIQMIYNKDIRLNNLMRAYVNLFLPNEKPYFHTDGNVTTCLFYFTPEYNIDEGGETQFYVQDKIMGVLPKPCRMVMFDGNLMHRATSYRSNPRITVALKFRV